MENILDEMTGMGLSVFLTVIGVLFFFAGRISWTVLYAAVTAYCLLEPLRTFLLIRSGRRRSPVPDTRRSLFNLLCGTVLLMHPSLFPVSMDVCAGIWMTGSAFLSAVDAWVCRNDGRRGAGSRILHAVIAMLLALFLFFGKAMRIKAWLLSLASGIFFVLCGLQGMAARIRMAHPDGWLSRHASWSLSVPLLLSVFYPLQACISLRALRSAPPDDAPDIAPDLWVYFYLKDTGMEVFGHVDIACGDTVYSYGCHDPRSRRLMGTLGDGVLIRCPRQAFLDANAAIDGKTIVGYGLRLSEEQKNILARKLDGLISRTVPWHCAAEEAADPAAENDYASRMWKAAHCSFFKFTGGKFRTYFVATTNCVLLADTLIRSRELSLISPTGIVTPGSYLTFLNQEYLLHNPAVPVRTVRNP